LTISPIPRIDLHIHSEFSPCSRDTTIESIVTVAEKKGLKKIAITDHGRVSRPDWLAKYLNEIDRVRKKTHLDVLTGMEVDIKPRGRLAVEANALRDLDVIIAALHWIPVLDILRKRSISSEYEAMILEALDANHFHILAHPTGLFWTKRIQSETLDKVIDRLKKEKIAVEINRHHNDPSLAFLEKCVEAGLSLTPSSDAHRLEEIGDFTWFENRIAPIQKPIRWIEI
jgi:DNA polymerase (family 10)